MTSAVRSTVHTGPVVRAVAAAPSVHGTQPWYLDFDGDTITLLERQDVVLPAHDPHGRDRALSCGAALTNLTVALRAQNLATRVTLLPDAGRPAVVADVTVTGTEPATATDLAWCAAIHRRRSHRAPFGLRPVFGPDRDAMCRAATGGGVSVRVVGRTECLAMADLVGHAAVAFRGDAAYQRELTGWLPDFPRPVPRESTLPWAGLVRADVRIPDRFTLADRLAREFLLVLCTVRDTHRDHVAAGMALERAWLAAVSNGLVASVLTQPWHLPETRAALRAHLSLPGPPHAVIRTGHPR